MSMGNKASRTGKCKCDNHKWSIFETRETTSCEAIITVDCANCKSLWDTKSPNEEIIKIMNPKEIEWYKGVLSKQIQRKRNNLDVIADKIAELEKERNNTLATIKKLETKIDSI